MIPKSGNRFSEKDHAQTKSYDPEKWEPVFGKNHVQTKSYDPEKWEPVFGNDHAQTKARS
jgi:hypothetical protein